MTLNSSIDYYVYVDQFQIGGLNRMTIKRGFLYGDIMKRYLDKDI
ncbi:hypothetical protein [Paenibacillus larvae]